MCEPLRKCMRDEDPYVRKTAAICVAKLHYINAQMVVDQGFVEMLTDLLSDANPMVVANAVAAITEINESHTLIEINAQTVNKLLTALNECTEWGQVFILDALANYQPKDEREAQNICERISPRLAHANAAVVLSTVKVLMKLLNMLSENSDFSTQLIKKLAPPMVTLLSAEPEIQYVALRNINLIVQKRPDILKQEMKVFFVKYNDPIYVKMEKLDIMIRLAQQSNIAQVLSELKEYAAEVDVDFVRKAVRAIGRCAIKVEQSAERCVNTLLELIQTKVNYVVQEAVVVIKDIFRKYPNRYEGIISTLCENLDTLDEPEARASMIWIVGEYAERIDNADELLESFVDGFHDENTQVQLQLLTAVVKLFLKRPNDTQQLVQKVLTLATQDSDNPDLRDRGYIYWRLLSADPQAAKEVVLAEKPLISEETDLLEPSLLNQLVCHIGSLASVYHRPPSSFVDPIRHPVKTAASQQEQQIVSPVENVQKQPTVIQPPQDSIIADLLSLDLSVPSAPAPATQQPSTSALISDIFGSPQPVAPPIVQPALASIFDTPPPAAAPTSIFGTPPPLFAPATVAAPASSPLDLLGSGGIGGTVPPQPQQPPSADIFGLSFGGSSGGDLTSLMGVGTAQANVGPYIPSYQIWLDASKGKGLQLEGRWIRRNGQIVAEMNLTNRALQALDGFAIQFNSNSFGLIPSSQFNPGTIFPNQTVSTTLTCSTNGPVQKMEPLSNLQVAVKNNIDVFYFAVVVPLNVYFDESGQMDKRDFLQLWKDIPEQNEIQFTIQNTKGLSADDICSVLQQNNVFTVARRTVDGQELLYHSIKYTNQVFILSELKMQQQNATLTLSLKSRHLSAIANLSDHYQDRKSVV